MKIHLDTPVKILFVTHYTALYGANRSLLSLVNLLAKKNYKILVLVPAEGPITHKLTDLKIPFLITTFFDEYYYNNLGSRLLGLKRHLLNRLHFKSILKEVDIFNPAIIHSNSAGLHLGAKLANKLKRPHVWHIREYGFEDYHALHNLGKKNHLKWLNKAAHIISISEVLRQAVLKQVQAPVSVIYNGVMSKTQMESYLPKNQQKEIIFTLAGSFRIEKGQEIAIRSFSQIANEIPQAILHLPGDASNNYGIAMKALANKLGIGKRVKFPGFVNEVDEVYKDTSILLMCSKNEAMGRVTAEAMARFIPVIAYHGGANPELITHEKEGLLYHTEMEMASAMILLAKDVASYKKMGEAAHQKALALFTEEHYVKSVEEIYAQVLVNFND